MKSILCCAAVSASMLLMASDTPEVSNVSMTQASFGRLVTVTYELNNAPNGAVITLDVQTNRTGAVTTDDADWISIGGEAVCNAQGDVWKKVAQGGRTITWRPDLSWEGHKVELANGGVRAVVTAWALDNTPDYMVVDISAGAKPNTQKYYPSADFVPDGVTNSRYKTSTLLMRKIMAKDVTWTMGAVSTETGFSSATKEATHQVTLTNNYYIGVFEVTQAQWAEVAVNSSASSRFTTEGLMRPMEFVRYNEIRNRVGGGAAISANDYPNPPNSESFLGKLNAKTGIDFDLPFEAQWEFAARAGHGSGYWGNGTTIISATMDSNLEQMARTTYSGKINGVDPSPDCGPTNGTAIVGSYLANDWGLFDMAGNVWEWCLDWAEDDIANAEGVDGEPYGGRVNVHPTDSTKTLSGGVGSNRIVRGGSWRNDASMARPACRQSKSPSSCDYNYGFRLCCPVMAK